MFVDTLEIELILKTDDKQLNIPGGNIEKVSGKLFQYGFEGEIIFSVHSEIKKDTIYPLFIKNHIIETNLLVTPHLNKKQTDKLVSLNLRGIVEEKKILSETPIENVHLKKEPVLTRKYFIKFKDKAQFFWKKHFPCDLKTNKKIIDLLKSNEIPLIKTDYKVPEFNEINYINTLPLGNEDNQASFYDFIVWYSSKFYAGLFYNYERDEYLLSKEIPEPTHNFLLGKTEVDWYHILFPVTAPREYDFLNVNAHINDKKTIGSSKGKYKGLKKSKVMNCSIVSEFEKKVNLEKKELNKKNFPLVELGLKKLPNINLCPNNSIKFSGTLWSDEQFVKNKEFQINKVFFEFNKTKNNLESQRGLDFGRFHIDINLTLFSKENKMLDIPKFNKPKFPLIVEGYVVSDVGEDREKTYQLYKDDRGGEYYKIRIPIFNNQEIVVPYEPIFLPGHFYFPLYKGAKVLIGLDIHSGSILKILDWREGAKLPLDTQGNSIVMGKDRTNKISVVSSYIDTKPQLEIKRVSKKDTQIVTLGEGTIIFETKDE